VIKIKIDFEKLLLAAFFALLLFIGPGITLNHKIMHDFPYGYSASDAFQHQVRAEAVKDAGSFRHDAPYISFGIENLVGRYPPVIYHLAVLLSYSAGLEVYDSIYFIVFFFTVIGILIMYFIIKNFNKNVALISLPLAILAFSLPPSIGFLWGHWPSLLAQFFLIAFAWCITNINLEKSYILTSVILAAIALTHSSEAAFAIIFAGLFFVVGFISNRLEKNFAKKFFISIILFFILASYYLVIFYNTWAKAQPYSFAVMPTWEGNPGFYLAGFGLLLLFILLGILFSLLKISSMHASIVFAFAMLISGFSNYIGFDTRAFQIRFFWPIYLSVFFGFGIYALLKSITKKSSMAFSIILFLLFTILLSGMIKLPFMDNKISLLGQEMTAMPHYKGSSSQGVMDSYHWSALKWLSKKSGHNSKVYFFYGDIYSQDALLRNSKRFHYQVDPKDFIKAIQEKKIKKSYISELPGDSGGRPVTRSGLFSFEDAMTSKPDEYFFGPQSICNFDYLVFDKVSQQQALAQYNLLIASELLKKDYIKKAFENEIVVILKNNNKGADCIEERSF